MVEVHPTRTEIREFATRVMDKARCHEDGIKVLGIVPTVCDKTFAIAALACERLNSPPTCTGPVLIVADSHRINDIEHELAEWDSTDMEVMLVLTPKDWNHVKVAALHPSSTPPTVFIVSTSTLHDLVRNRPCEYNKVSTYRMRNVPEITPGKNLQTCGLMNPLHRMQILIAKHREHRAASSTGSVGAGSAELPRDMENLIMGAEIAERPGGDTVSLATWIALFRVCCRTQLLDPYLQGLRDMDGFCAVPMPDETFADSLGSSIKDMGEDLSAAGELVVRGELGDNVTVWDLCPHTLISGTWVREEEAVKGLYASADLLDSTVPPGASLRQELCRRYGHERSPAANTRARSMFPFSCHIVAFAAFLAENQLTSPPAVCNWLSAQLRTTEGMGFPASFEALSANGVFLEGLPRVGLAIIIDDGNNGAKIWQTHGMATTKTTIALATTRLPRLERWASDDAIVTLESAAGPGWDPIVHVTRVTVPEHILFKERWQLYPPPNPRRREFKSLDDAQKYVASREDSAPFPSGQSLIKRELDRLVDPQAQLDRCPSCRDCKPDCVLTGCGHTMCHVCLESDQRWDRSQGTCPTCSEPVGIPSDVVSVDVFFGAHPHFLNRPLREIASARERAVVVGGDLFELQDMVDNVRAFGVEGDRILQIGRDSGPEETVQAMKSFRATRDAVLITDAHVVAGIDLSGVDHFVFDHAWFGHESLALFFHALRNIVCTDRRRSSPRLHFVTAVESHSSSGVYGVLHDLLPASTTLNPEYIHHQRSLPGVNTPALGFVDLVKETAPRRSVKRRRDGVVETPP